MVKKKTETETAIVKRDEFTLEQVLAVRELIRAELFVLMCVAKAANPAWNCPVAGMLEYLR